MRSKPEDLLAQHIRLLGLHRPEREYCFHDKRRWRFDFAWPEYMIACEVEGGTWIAGRHSRGKGFSDDCIKYAEAALLGWRVFRFTSEQIGKGIAINYLERALML